jgi:hypothetical protein
LGKILGEIRGRRVGGREVVAGHHAILHKGTLTGDVKNQEMPDHRRREEKGIVEESKTRARQSQKGYRGREKSFACVVCV